MVEEAVQSTRKLDNIAQKLIDAFKIREAPPGPSGGAAAAGRPVVTTDWPGCRSAVREGVTGLLVPPGDVPALAGALAEVVRNPRFSTGVGLLISALEQKKRDEHARLHTANIKGVFEKMASWFKGNF